MDFELIAKQYQDELGKAGVALTMNEARAAIKPIYQKLQKDDNVSLLSSMLGKLKHLALNAEHASQKFLALFDRVNGEHKLTEIQKQEFNILKQKYSEQMREKTAYVEQQIKTKKMLDEYIRNSIEKTAKSLHKEAPPPVQKTTSHQSVKKRSAPMLVSFSSEKNKRKYMEDKIVVQESLSLLPNDKQRYSFFMVCDGHAGSKAADYVSDNFIKRLKEIVLQTQTLNLPEMHPDKHPEIFIPAILQHTISELIEEWDSDSFRTNRTFADDSGTTVIIMMIDKKTGIASFLNLGDSRAVVYDSSTHAVVLQTKDHSLDSKNEIKMVQARTHKITGESCRVTKTQGDVFRIEDNIAMSRSFGDNNPRTAGCLGRESDIYTFSIKESPLVSVLASDGLWDEHSAENVSNMIFKENLDANQIVQRVVTEGTVGDNCSIIVVDICPSQFLKK